MTFLPVGLAFRMDLLASDDQSLMRQALRQAEKAAAADEVPVGAVIVRNGRIIARSFNQIETLKDPTAHAEMLAITQATAAIGDWRLNECELFVTKEPCPMCAGAAVQARLRRLVYGCADPRAGAAGSKLNLLEMPEFNHRCEVKSGLLAQECAGLLQEFFRLRRDQAQLPS
jgi:tRNA(adenine34) deaminase